MIYINAVFSLQSLHSFRMMENCKTLKAGALQDVPTEDIF